MNKQEAIQEQIDEIMDTFEFERVAAWMEFSKWGWADGHETVVPDLYAIKREARARLREAARFGYTSTGGFTAKMREGAEDGKPWLALDLSFGYNTAQDGTEYAP